MDDAAAAYTSQGLYVIGGTVSTSNTWVSGFFGSEDITNCHNLAGSGQNAAWSQYGYVGNLPWKVFFDRDGNVRKTGSSFNQFTNVIEECLGVN